MARASYIEPLEQETTPSIIARKLREAIGHGELPPGAQLGEAALAAQLGVSRGPLREAMQRLTQEGLLVSYRNRGLFVIDPDAEDIRDMYRARTAVERAAAVVVLDGDHQEAGAQLAAIVDTMDRAAERGDTARTTAADMDFHDRLVTLSGSPRLNRMHLTLLTETRMCLNFLRDRYQSERERVVEHRGIADAVTAGDAALVDELLLAHMHDALHRLDSVAA